MRSNRWPGPRIIHLSGRSCRRCRLPQVLREGFLKPEEKVILNTGSGLKYPELVEVELPVLEKGAKYRL